MSYLVLARKWRPLVFKDVLGQQHVTVTLENAIKSNRLANAYLFSGPRGVGKTTVARILAKAINCAGGPTITPCNKCESCTEITESRSLDVFEIDGASNRGIDEVRNLRENLRYAPNKGKYKIYIIDEVHMLTMEAFNALLKTLEEPPKNVLFIFATTEPHKVPATISSRCQRFTFKRMPIKKIIQQLKIICENEGIEIDDDSLLLIAKKADGSMRDSQSILDQAFSFSGRKIVYEQILELLGIIDNELLFELSESIKTKDVKRVLNLVDMVFMEGYDVGEFLMLAVEHFRNMLITKITNNTERLEVSEALAQRYLADAKKFAEEDLLRYLKIATDAEYSIKRSANPRLKLEFTLLKMVKMETTLSLGALLQKLDNLKSEVNTDPPIAEAAGVLKDSAAVYALPQQVTSPALSIEQRKSEILNYLGSGPAATVNSGDIKNSLTENSANIKQIALDEIKKRWPDVIQEIKTKKVALGVFVDEGVPTAVNKNIVDIMFDQKNDFHINLIIKNRIFIEKVISSIFDTSIKINCVKGVVEKKSAPTQNVNVVEKPVQQTKTDVVSEKSKNEVLEEIMSVFDGEIVS